MFKRLCEPGYLADIHVDTRTCHRQDDNHGRIASIVRGEAQTPLLEAALGADAQRAWQIVQDHPSEVG